jgi:dTDP-L-rhamnose 4-epimerase
MRVLLTGGSGFIGRHVVAALVERGHDVRVLDVVEPDDLDIAHVVGDVRDPSAVDAAVDGVEAVVHLAAKVGLGVDLQDMPEYAGINVTGTATLLAAMARVGIGRLVLASSMVIYGEGLGRCVAHGAVRPGARLPADLRAGRFEPPCPDCGRPLAAMTVGEDAVPDPRNTYAVSKLAQEQLAAAWARATASRAVALRYHNVYGPGMPRDTPYAGVAAIFLSALDRGEPPRVFEDGRQRRDFVHVRDVASATAAALLIPGDGPVALNVGSGTPRTVGEFAAALATATSGPSPEVTGQFRLGDVRHITADSARARALLGWQPTVDFATGIAELARQAQ